MSTWPPATVKIFGISTLQLAAKVKSYYDDAKVSLWAELTPEFIKTIPNALLISTLSKDREDYIRPPCHGEKLTPQSIEALKKLRDSWGADLPKGQIVISDGLNAKAIMDEGPSVALSG